MAEAAPRRAGQPGSAHRGTGAALLAGVGPVGRGERRRAPAAPRLRGPLVDADGGRWSRTRPTGTPRACCWTPWRWSTPSPSHRRRARRRRAAAVTDGLVVAVLGELGHEEVGRLARVRQGAGTGLALVLDVGSLGDATGHREATAARAAAAAALQRARAGGRRRRRPGPAVAACWPAASRTRGRPRPRAWDRRPAAATSPPAPARPLHTVAPRPDESAAAPLARTIADRAVAIASVLASLALAPLFADPAWYLPAAAAEAWPAPAAPRGRCGCRWSCTRCCRARRSRAPGRALRRDVNVGVPARSRRGRGAAGARARGHRRRERYAPPAPTPTGGSPSSSWASGWSRWSSTCSRSGCGRRRWPVCRCWRCTWSPPRCCAGRALVGVPGAVGWLVLLAVDRRTRWAGGRCSAGTARRGPVGAAGPRVVRRRPRASAAPPRAGSAGIGGRPTPRSWSRSRCASSPRRARTDRTGLGQRPRAGRRRVGRGRARLTIDPFVSLRRDYFEAPDRVVIRYHTDDPDPAYLRLTTLEVFDGTTWRSDEFGSATPAVSTRPAGPVDPHGRRPRRAPVPATTSRARAPLPSAALPAVSVTIGAGWYYDPVDPDGLQRRAGARGALHGAGLRRAHHRAELRAPPSASRRGSRPDRAGPPDVGDEHWRGR